MFHQQVCGADLALSLPTSIVDSSTGGRAVVFGHVDLEPIGIGSWWGLPAAAAVDRVEVVWEVLGLAVSNFPIRRESCLGLIVKEEWHVSLG